MSGVVVRRAREEDVDAVVALERGLATAPHWAGGEYVRMVREDGPVRRCLLVAEAEGEVVGFAVGAVVAGGGELESVAVGEAWQARGIGGELIDGVVGWCRREGAGEVELEVRAASVGVRRLYGRLGFEEVGRRRSYYSEPEDDAVQMRKRL